MTKIFIRPAGPEDASLILDFIQALADYEKLSDEVIADEAQIIKSLFGDKPQAEALIAFLDGEPVGFALFFHNFSTFLGKHGLYLEDLFVNKGARGAGVGKALLKHLANIALDRGCGRMEWWVLDWNTPSIDFYKKLGAEPMEDWTVFRLRGDALKTFVQN